MSLTSALVDADDGNGSGRDKATTSACPEDDDDDFTISVSFKSRRCGHLLASAKCVLLYLSLVIALLIASTLFLVGASAFRTRSHLVPPNRQLHWYLLLLTAALIAWLSFSITVLGRRQDNLGRITALGLAALILLLMDTILLCRLIVGFALAQGINGKLQLAGLLALHCAAVHCLHLRRPSAALQSFSTFTSVLVSAVHQLARSRHRHLNCSPNDAYMTASIKIDSKMIAQSEGARSHQAALLIKKLYFTLGSVHCL